MLSRRKGVRDFSSFDDLESIIINHRAINHPLFQYLHKAADKGLTSQQFAIYRCNFFHRTFNTIPCISLLVIAAARNLDMTTLATAGKNLYEETGSNNPERAHSLMLQESHNIHAATVFGLAPMTLNEASASSLLLPETKVFQQTQAALYSSENYGVVLGAAYAHEFAANSMLINFYESLFVSYKDHYTIKDFYNVTKYFLSHMCGVEEDHAAEIKLAAKNYAINDINLRYLLEGVLGFLSAQALLWDGMLREMEASALVGTTIISDKICNF